MFSEQVSAIGKRQELGKALEFVRAGDTLVITKIDRLARNSRTLGEIVDDRALEAAGLRRSISIITGARFGR